MPTRFTERVMLGQLGSQPCGFVQARFERHERENGQHARAGQGVCFMDVSVCRFSLLQFAVVVQFLIGAPYGKDCEKQKQADQEHEEQVRGLHGIWARYASPLVGGD